MCRGKLGPTSIGGVLCNFKAEVLISFSRPIRIKDSIEAEVLAILEALKIYSRLHGKNLIAKSDSHNAISWASQKVKGPPLYP